MAEVAPLDTEDSGPQALQKELFIHLQNFESLPPQETAPLDLDQPRSLMFIDGNEKIQNHQTGDRNLDQINISSNDQLIEKYKVHHTCNGPEAKVSNKQSSVEQILHRLPIANQPTSPSKIDETFLKNISIYDSHDSTNTEESFDCTKNSASTDPALEATTFEASEKYNLYETSVKVESFADTKFEFSENISITKSIAISSSTDTFYSLASSKDDSNPPSSDSLSPDTLHQTSFTSIEDSILQKNVDVLTADFSNIDFNLVACETRILNVDLSSTGSYKQPNDEIDPSCDDLINESEDEILRENHNPNHHFCQNKSSEFDKLNQEISKDSGSNVSLDKKMNPTMYGKMVKTIQHQFKKILSLGVNNNKECLKPLKNTEKDRINQQDSFQEISNATTTILTSASAQSPITQVAPENSDTSPSYQPPQCNSALLESYRMYTSMNLCSFPLLGKQMKEHAGRKCLLLDLDETLVHSSFQPVSNADLLVPITINGSFARNSATTYPIYVTKRPGVDAFLEAVFDLFEVVIFTASLASYADPVINFLDPKRRLAGRLYRDSCVLLQGMYIKDISRVGRHMNSVVLVDNSPTSYALQPQNALPCRSWFSDMNDSELVDRLLPLLRKLHETGEEDGVLRWREENQQEILLS